MTDLQNFYLAIYDKPLGKDDIKNLNDKCIGVQEMDMPPFQPKQLAVTYQAAYGCRQQLKDINSFVCVDEEELMSLRLYELPSYIGKWNEAELFSLATYHVGVMELQELRDAIRTTIHHSENLRKTYAHLRINGGFPILDELTAIEMLDFSEENLRGYLGEYFEDRRIREKEFQS